jgi:anti-sigma-K factor RskA
VREYSGVATYDEDKEALAAEYVLGTLSADERDQAETLLSIDPRFEEAVREWERRLGELNVMVEAVEPPPQLWDKVKTKVEGASDLPLPAEPAAEEGEAPQLPHIDETELHAPETLESEAGVEEPTAAEPAHEELFEELGTDAVPAAFEPSLLPPHTEPSAAESPQVPGPDKPQAAARAPGKIERSADVVYIAGQMHRWRRLAFVCGALAAVLALYVASWHVAPGLLPARLRPAGFAVAHGPALARAQQDRLVAVLQQEPVAPAFLLTFDTRDRTLFVRRMTAAPEAGHSFQLWLMSSKFSTPRSLGLIDPGAFTQRTFPANFDVDTLRTASYVVSLEPTAGSPRDTPSGPVLFTGKAVESLPAAPPASRPGNSIQPHTTNAPSK